MEDSINIENMIENNSLVNLSNTYENRLLNKIKLTFTAYEQKMFVSNFYLFVKYDENKDFVVDFDSTWKVAGFSRKDAAKRLLVKHFNENTDYKVVIKPSEGVPAHGGQNNEHITLTINTFKKFCLKAGTKKADEIHDYYIKLVDLLHETIDEETSELREQLKLREQNIVELLDSVSHQMKKCTKCLVEYDLVTGFNKDNSKKDGFHSLCKVCGKEQKINFKERKRAEFVELVEKNCNICKETKPISNFIKHIYTKDGYVNNCTKCCNEVKSRARKMEKDNNVRYKCGCCNKEYSRKDTLSRHIKICPSKTTENHSNQTNLSTQQLENEVVVN
jgi:phage anti-repressor protein